MKTIELSVVIFVQVPDHLDPENIAVENVEALTYVELNRPGGTPITEARLVEHETVYGAEVKED